MDWLRSEDLKEEKNVTAPTIIIAAYALCRWSRTGRAYHWACSESIQNSPTQTLLIAGYPPIFP